MISVISIASFFPNSGKCLIYFLYFYRYYLINFSKSIISSTARLEGRGSTSPCHEVRSGMFALTHVFTPQTNRTSTPQTLILICISRIRWFAQTSFTHLETLWSPRQSPECLTRFDSGSAILTRPSFSVQIFKRSLLKLYQACKPIFCQVECLLSRFNFVHLLRRLRSGDVRHSPSFSILSPGTCLSFMGRRNLEEWKEGLESESLSGGLKNFLKAT